SPSLMRGGTERGSEILPHQGTGGTSCEIAAGMRPPLQRLAGLVPPISMGTGSSKKVFTGGAKRPPSANRSARRHERTGYSLAGHDGRRFATCTSGREGGAAGPVGTGAKRTP